MPCILRAQLFNLENNLLLHLVIFVCVYMIAFLNKRINEQSQVRCLWGLWKGPDPHFSQGHWPARRFFRDGLGVESSESRICMEWYRRLELLARIRRGHRLVLDTDEHSVHVWGVLFLTSEDSGNRKGHWQLLTLKYSTRACSQFQKHGSLVPTQKKFCESRSTVSGIKISGSVTLQNFLTSWSQEYINSKLPWSNKYEWLYVIRPCMFVHSYVYSGFFSFTFIKSWEDQTYLKNMYHYQICGHFSLPLIFKIDTSFSFFFLWLGSWKWPEDCGLKARS